VGAVSASVKLRLKPLTTPNFVSVDVAGAPEAFTVPIKELDHDALEELAYGYLIDLYKKAGKTCPFYRPARCAEASK
jgi:hypothetical protein